MEELGFNNNSGGSSGSGGTGGSGSPGLKATGLSSAVMAAEIIASLDLLAAEANSYINNGEFDAEGYKEASHKSMSKAIGDYIKSNCYATGSYIGVLASTGTTDLNLNYNFEVQSCELSSTLMNNTSGTSYDAAINSYTYRLARAIESSLIFKVNDVTKYLTIAQPVMLLPNSLHINVKKNTAGNDISREQAFQKVTDAVVDGLRNAQFFIPSYSTISKGPGAGNTTFQKIN